MFRTLLAILVTPGIGVEQWKALRFGHAVTYPFVMSLRSSRSLAHFLGILLLTLPSIAQDEVDNRTDEALLPSEVAPTNTDETAARIVDLHLQARGGSDALRAIQSLHLRGTIREGKSLHQLEWWWQAPQAYRVERWHEHLGQIHHSIRATDGEAVWTRDIAPKLERAREGDMQALRDLRWDGMVAPLVFRHLLGWRDNGHIFAFEGTVPYRGRDTYLIKAKLNDGPVVFYYFDKQTFLLRALGVRDRFGDATVNADVVPTTAERVEGVIVETGWKWLVGGRAYRDIDFETIEANVQGEPARFAMPKQRELWLRQEGLTEPTPAP